MHIEIVFYHQTKPMPFHAYFKMYYTTLKCIIWGHEGLYKTAKIHTFLSSSVTGNSIQWKLKTAFCPHWQMPQAGSKFWMCENLKKGEGTSSKSNEGKLGNAFCLNSTLEDGNHFSSVLYRRARYPCTGNSRSNNHVTMTEHVWVVSAILSIVTGKAERSTEMQISLSTVLSVAKK